MSTEDQNRCVVTSQAGVDIDQLMDEIVNGTLLGRTVEMYNEKPDSERNFDVVLTREEAEQLKQDPRVLDVRYGSKQENGFFFRPTRSDSSRTYAKSSSQNNAHYNWGVPACINSVNPFSSGTSISYSHSYPLDGTGVDVVIQDSGIEADHPEWLNYAGTASRFQNINWPITTGMQGSYTQGANHYTDQEGHGTHVAGTVAGRRYGWAKGADIYAIKIFDTDAFGVSASINMIRLFHTNKGNIRPTIVNMSWGYYAFYTGITGGLYRGTPWTGVSPDSAKGMVQSPYNYDSNSGLYYHPVRVSSVDADLETMMNAGVIAVAASGNEAHKTDVSGGTDYNNYYTTNSGNVYYHRGSTPNSDSVISVGAISTVEGKSSYSNTGPKCNIWAPGDYIQSAMARNSTIAGQYSTVSYPDDSNYLAVKISGTSMASPQVTGVLACMLSSRYELHQAQALAWLVKHSTKNRLSDSGGSYTDYTSLQGSANRYLRQPYNTATPWNMYNGASITRS